jgi:hypothetical protein
MEDVGTLDGHLVYFNEILVYFVSFGTFCDSLVHLVVIWYILWSFGIFCGSLVHFMVILVVLFFPFWYVVPRKIWQPWTAFLQEPRSYLSNKIWHLNSV